MPGVSSLEIPPYNVQESSAYDLISGRVPLVTAARIVKVGLLSSLAFGLLQDALGLARGRRVGYVDLFLGRSRRGQNTENLII